ncbi:hypothetical protein B0H15DRAFT_918828 [Mycena belliarum]|uniref:SH3 domain-containing protein n=1 Tax=Mycena belliarum TaxID=1033014 RepID=A0AAD6Y037_9AGAR|nr:hypothetical protein B0H15DRAFT_918828 [Mycena belliae]
MPVLARRSADAPPVLSPQHIAGIVLCAVLVLSVAVWLALRRCRARAQARREKTRVAAFTPVRGVYRESDPEKNVQATGGNTFSRAQLTPSVVLPDKVLARPTTHDAAHAHDAIVDFHRQSGTSPKPFSFALAAPASAAANRARPASRASPSPRSSWIRHSTASLASTRFSVLSSAASSVDTTPTAGAPRKVRRLFSPVLPDELLLTALGERLTVVHAFDDGWVVVGRASPFPFASAPKSLFNKAPAPGESDVELGVVPAWCFLKPVKGLRAERPVRNTSLGITVQMDVDASGARDDVLSWSNF